MSSGPTSYGYMRKGGRIVLDPKEAPIRKRIFELFFEHQRKKTVAEILNADGARTRNGSYFTGQTISRLLNDSRVIGIDGKIEPLISEKLYNQCQDILKAQAKDGGAKRKPRHLFAGIAECECGGKMYIPTGSHKYVCRECKKKIHKRDLEAVYIERLIEYLQNHNAPAKLISACQDWSLLPFDTKRNIIDTTTTTIIIDNNKVTLSIIPFGKT